MLSRVEHEKSLYNLEAHVIFLALFGSGSCTVNSTECNGNNGIRL